MRIFQMVSLVSNQCKYCNSNNDVWVIKRRTNFYSIAPLLWELYLILENPWLNTKLPHILCGSTRLVVGTSTFHNRAGEQPTLRVGQAGIYHHFCSFYLPYRTLHLISRVLLKAYGKAGKRLVFVQLHPATAARAREGLSLSPWYEMEQAKF